MKSLKIDEFYRSGSEILGVRNAGVWGLNEIVTKSWRSFINLLYQLDIGVIQAWRFYLMDEYFEENETGNYCNTTANTKKGAGKIS